VSGWEKGPNVVELPDGRRLRGRGLRRPPPKGSDPDFAVYLLGRDPGPCDWEYRWVRWSDFRTPASTIEAVGALEEAYERAATGRVEIACGGGVGRTGAALAGVAVLAGVPPAEAVDWVRHRYHRRAAETPGQRRWVLELDRDRLDRNHRRYLEEVALSDEKYILITTFRRNGEGVATPVWVVPVEDGKVGFWTSSGSGKAKRLAHTPRVTVQPCDGRGKVKAGTEPLEATARVVSGTELDDIRRKVVAKYGFLTKVTKLLGTIGGIVKGKRIPYGDRGVIVSLPD